MTRRRRLVLGAAVVASVAVVAITFAGALRRERPEDVALAYGRAVYANDAEALWSLISEADRRVKDKETFRRQQRDLRGFTREVVELLSREITATPVSSSFAGERGRITLRFRLPDANAAPIRTLLLGWDEDRLRALDARERTRLRDELERLRRSGRLPTIEGDESIELVREAAVWKVFLGWAGGVTVRFGATADANVPLAVTVTPSRAVLGRGEQLRVTVRVTNTSKAPVTTRVGHVIEPAAESPHLAMLQCPLFIPVTFKPGETRDFESDYLLVRDAPATLPSLTVTYRFPADPAGSR